MFSIRIKAGECIALGDWERNNHLLPLGQFVICPKLGRMNGLADGAYTALMCGLLIYMSVTRIIFQLSAVLQQCQHLRFQNIPKV